MNWLLNFVNTKTGQNVLKYWLPVGLFLVGGTVLLFCGK